MAEVRAIGIGKRYGSAEALSELTLTIPDHEFFVVFGPSGAGKSTLLKLVAGIVEPEEGELRIGGASMKDVPTHKRNVAMAFESYALYPHLSVRRNLEFPLKAPGRNLTAAERATRVARVAELLEIDALLERRPSQLSGGQRQRVSLGRALVRRAAVTLLDEPLAHLDARLRHALRSELKHYQREEGATTIYTTPDYVEAFGIADRLAVLIDGCVQQVGTPEEVYGAPANLHVAGLVGDPKMNLIPVAESRRLVFDGQSVTLPDMPRLRAPGLGYVGIRATDIELSTSPLDGAIDGRVYVAEPTGADQVVRVEVAGELLTAKIPLRGTPLAIGQQVWLAPQWERVHAFASDGTRIGS